MSLSLTLLRLSMTTSGFLGAPMIPERGRLLVLRARDPNIPILQHDISLLSYQRTFFVTKDGYMGVGPRCSRTGDRIALIAGLKLPFVIREAGDRYNLIGPAYIHGIMKGERWDENLLTQIIIV